MKKRVFAVLLAALLMFATMIPAFATTIISKNEAALAGAKAAYSSYCYDKDMEYDETIADAFTITRMIKADADADYKYDVTVRSGYEWVYTCRLDVITTDIIVDTTTYFVVGESGAIENCNTIAGFIGTLLDAIVNFFANL